MRLLHLECRAGLSGDMVTAALLDLLGEDSWSELERVVDGLGLEGARIAVKRIRKSGFAAVDFETTEEKDPPHRTLTDIEDLLVRSGLSDEVRETSIQIFRKLARAEAEAHGTDESHIHFHEVGAADSIIDIVAASWAFHRLKPERVTCSPLPLGNGTVRCAHGELPVPAPATVILTRGIPVYGSDIQGEAVTPTGAAIATTVAQGFGPLPPCIIERTGVGAGKVDRTQVNVLRAYLCTVDTVPAAEEATTVVQIETTIDDMNPEAYPPLLDRLLEAGALDVHLCPVQMKKGRPGIVVSVLADPSDRDEMARILLLHSSTFGVRFSEKRRVCLERRIVSVETSFGPVRVKEGMLDGNLIKAVPEHEDCRALAEKASVSYLDVYEAALVAARGQGR